MTAQDVTEAIGPLPVLNLGAMSGVTQPANDPVVLGWITAPAILSLGLLGEVGDRVPWLP